MDYIIYIDDYLIEDNPVRVMDAFVDSLDMVKLDIKMPNLQILVV